MTTPENGVQTRKRDAPTPTRRDNETAQEFFTRMQEWDLVAAANASVSGGALKTKKCSVCGHENGANAKRCVHSGTRDTRCNNPLSLSNDPSAVLSREKRKKRRIKKQEKRHDICGICLKNMRTGQELGMPMCFSQNGLNPCGRVAHLSCLQRQLCNSYTRHVDYGILPLVCTTCKGKLFRDLPFVEIRGPGSSRSRLN